MPLTKPQQTICNDTRRFRVAVCGRRFGKTHLSLRELARFAAPANQRVIYVAPTYGMAKRIMWEPLKKKLLSLRWIKKINESELTIKLINGSQISLRSADNPDSLRGEGNNFVVLDEAADMDAAVWHEVLRATLSDKMGHAMFLGTPKGMNWLKDMYDMALVDPENWASFQFTTLEGGNVPDSEVEAARRDLPEKTFKQEYEASFESYSGKCYYSFSNDNIGETTQITDRDTLLVGLDFNVSPLCAVIGVRRGDELHIIDEIMINDANSYEFATELRRRYPKHTIEIFPDASGAQRRTSSNTTDHAILSNAGFKVRVGRINPAVIDRIAAVNGRLCSIAGNRYIRINKACRQTIKCLTSQVYKEGTRQPEKGEFDHMNDALGYLVNWFWPIRRDIDTKDQPTYWSNY